MLLVSWDKYMLYRFKLKNSIISVVGNSKEKSENYHMLYSDSHIGSVYHSHSLLLKYNYSPSQTWKCDMKLQNFVTFLLIMYRMFHTLSFHPNWFCVSMELWTNCNFFSLFFFFFRYLKEQKSIAYLILSSSIN